MKRFLFPLVIFAQTALADAPVDTECKQRFSSDVVIVGSGGGGLAAGAGLALGGKKVIVIEQHFKVGGYMTNFKRKDYTFEVSLHGFDALNPDGMNRKLFQKLGILDRVTPVQHDVIYQAHYPDQAVFVPKDIGEYKAMLLAQFPQEVDSIEKYFETVKKLDSIYAKIGSYTLGETTSFPSIPDLFDMKYYAGLKLTDFLKKDLKIKDEKLIHVLTQLSAFLGTPPKDQSTMLFLTMWNSYHRYGFYNFLGGSQAVANAMADVITEHGGLIHTRNLVVGMDVENGEVKLVRTKQGNCYEAPYVVSNASIPGTIKLLGEKNVSKGDLEKYKKWKTGPSMVSVYLGVDHDYTENFGKSPELIVNTSYDPSEADDFANRCQYDGPYAAVNYSMIDPAYTKTPGKNVIALSVLANYDCFNTLPDYQDHKKELAEKLIQRVETFLPELSKHIEVMEVGTPMTMERYTLNPRGSIIGYDHNVDQVMFKRMNNTQLEGIRNLYLVGAWTFPGGGQSAVMISGYQAALDILHRDDSGIMGPIMRFFKKVVAYIGSL